MPEINTRVPAQNQGSESNTSASRDTETVERAKEFYQIVKHRLFNINQWQQYANLPSGEFNLYDNKGNRVERLVELGDYFRIKIPGPDNVSGKGYDWVKVESINEVKNEESEECNITVRPCEDPLVSSEEISHFFDNSATSSFIVKRNRTEVTVMVLGRNEKPNTDVESLGGKLRNSIVAVAAITGMAKVQWKGLVNGILNTDC